MKKFGTPIGAGPGSDNENVGFFADGTPFPVGSFALGCLDLLFGFVFFFATAGWVDEGFSLRLAPDGEGVVVVDELVVVDEDVEFDDEAEVEVELEGELVVELEALLDDDGAVVVVVVVVVVEVPAGVATHVSVSDAMPVSVIGSGICATGVPGGTSGTLNVYDWPVRSETVTVHVSAEAEGSAANAITMRAALAITSTATSFRRWITAALLL